jgi:hypothetical protein
VYLGSLHTRFLGQISTFEAQVILMKPPGLLIP